ncbi:MAG: HAD family hydrolase [Clostridia bacterium]|nr:HAD family hydrolase [Clostridia bacterium]
MTKPRKNYGTVLFDLDGTLTDPKEGITKSVAYALSHFGIEVPDLDRLCKFIGPPLDFSFREYYGLEAEDVKVAIDKYREIFSEVGIFQNKPYQGMNELLAKLCERNKTLLVATSKPTVYAERILEKYGMIPYFTAVIGSELNGGRSDKAEVIATALQQNGLFSTDDCIMVGDREYDILGAAANGIDSVGVLYGYGTYEELKKAGATYLVADLNQLSSILLS